MDTARITRLCAAGKRRIVRLFQLPRPNFPYAELSLWNPNGDDVMVALAHGSFSQSVPASTLGTDHGSLFSRLEWWLVRRLDALADRRDAQKGLALMAALDDRVLADIGYGAEDAFRPGHR
ncbi:hypothetical protein [Rhodospirillum sp. A1_3_36]|uniref:hypothetical protein n=1 Tax=Rhodospirillum sp. A1_3_36 TaxID=3391666 RepID=UPI0039A5D05E